MCPLTDMFAGYDWLIKHGGRSLRRQPDPVPEPEPPAPEAAPATEEAKPTVTLRDLKWEKESGAFACASRISVHADLPEALKNITRVRFTLFALDARGRREKLAAQEGHLKDGFAETKFELPHTPGEDGGTEPERAFICVATHRDSQPLESAKHTAQEKARLELVLEDAQAWKRSGYIYCLVPAGSGHKRVLKPGDGEEKDGKLTLRFEDLDAAERYTLEIREEKEDRLRQAVFKERSYGEWLGK